MGAPTDQLVCREELMSWEICGVERKSIFPSLRILLPILLANSIAASPLPIYFFTLLLRIRNILHVVHAFIAASFSLYL